MSTAPEAASAHEPDEAQQAPRTFGGRLRLIGPGIVLALSSVGASGLITTMLLYGQGFTISDNGARFTMAESVGGLFG